MKESCGYGIEYSGSVKQEHLLNTSATLVSQSRLCFMELVKSDILTEILLQIHYKFRGFLPS
jgi:hypothetical protein